MNQKKMKSMRLLKRITHEYYGIIILFTVSIISYSCSDINFDLPPGPQGPQGLSAYEVWKVEAQSGKLPGWPTNKTEIIDYFTYIKGEKGDKGEDGKSAYELWKMMITDGKTPNPHKPDEMWEKNRNTETDFWNYLAGKNGESPHIGVNGNWWIGNKDTKIPARGRDGENGQTPYVGRNGNWWIGIVDMGIPAKGIAGVDGKDGVSPFVGENGNWWIGNKDTNIPAKGKDGEKGIDGKSAYEVWKEKAEKGELTDPKDPNKKWPKDKTDISHFIQYLTGANGKDGVDGKNGIDGKDGQTPYVGPNGNWWIGGKDTNVKAKGENGKDGVDGEDGKTPYVGENGNWWIGTTDTNVKAKGENGKDGTSPHIGENGNWWIGTTDTGKPARGEKGEKGDNGQTPHVGENGNWWIGTTDTGKPSKGKDGKDGATPHVGENGNWWIGTTDTNIKAKGEKGTDGTDGVAGKSAYELWIEDVNQGKITNPNTGEPWPTTEITQAHFWKYLRGKDGEKGEKGGSGKSAYEIWKSMVETGNLDNPKNPEVKWPKDKNSEIDFWEFLMGKDGIDGKNGIDGIDGKSAYELWVEEVNKGLPNPHEPGTNWPKEKTSTDNFWEFLSGKDGKDGIAGKPGEPGKPIEIVTGVPNVIAQYALQEYSEYVRWSDGAVMYKVYDNVGQLAPGAKVKGLPGLEPNKEYTANSKGEFLVPKEDLPEGKDISELVGKTLEVTYLKSTGQTVTEASAANTYVPNRIHVRLMRRSNYGIDGSDINVYTKCERHTGRPDSNWEVIPEYLGNLSQRYRAFELSDSNDPSSFDEDSKPYYNNTQNLRSSNIYIKRPRVKPGFRTMVDNEWDGKDHYYIIQMESYYGEKPILPAVIKNAPIQYSPIINNISSVKTYAEGLNSVAEITVEFDVSDINRDLIFSGYTTEKTVQFSDTDYEYWAPIIHKTSADSKMFTIAFVYSLQSGDHRADNSSNRASINQPTSRIGNVHVLSNVSVSATGSYFVDAGSIGSLKFDKTNMKLSFIGAKDSYKTIPDILDIPIIQ